MSQRRVELQRMLENMLGSRNVYYQPPTSIKLKYPCILYNLESANDVHAENDIYRRLYRYSLTYITKDPEDPMWEMINDLRYCRFDRFYTSDNMNHFVYTIYY